MNDFDDQVPAPEAPSGPGIPVSDVGSQGSVARLFGIFLSPSATMTSVAARPGWLVPLIGWMIVASVMTFAIFSMVDQVEFMKNQLRASSLTRQMTDEEIDEVAEQSANSTVARVMRYINPLLGPPIILFLIAGLLWLLLLLLGTELKFKGVLAVLAHSMFAYASISGGLLIAILYFAEDPNVVDMTTAVSTNLGFLVDANDHPVLKILVSSFDILLAYFVILMGLGLSGLSKRVSIWVGMISITMLYGVYVALQMGIALIF